MKKPKLKAGDRVRTNDKLAELFRGEIKKPWVGTLRREAVAHGTGCWAVQIDGAVPVQYIHETFLEVVS